MSASGRKQVLILGGGFGGLYTALGLERKLARDGDVAITLVNRENFSLFTPMLHEVAASDLDMTHIVNPVRKLLKHVQFFHCEVEHIDLASKRVTVVHGEERHAHELRYDYLVLALGSMTNFFGLPARYAGMIRAYGGYVPIGFFQMWHAKHGRRYPIAKGDAEHTDVLHAIQWSEERRHLIPEVVGVHIQGTPAPLGSNWKVRSARSAMVSRWVFSRARTSASASAAA